MFRSVRTKLTIRLSLQTKITFDAYITVISLKEKTSTQLCRQLKTINYLWKMSYSLTRELNSKLFFFCFERIRFEVLHFRSSDSFGLFQIITFQTRRWSAFRKDISCLSRHRCTVFIQCIYAFYSFGLLSPHMEQVKCLRT